MSKHFVKKLHIDCDGLSQKSVHELADELKMYFFAVDVHGDTILAAEPVNQARYDDAWKAFDHYGVKVT